MIPGRLLHSTFALLVTSALFSFGFVTRAATPFTGFYNGAMYITISGSVSLPERAIGPVAFNIKEDGSISSSGDLSGTVANDGAITWITPNTGNFLTGQVASGVITSTGSQTANGTTTTFRVSASNTAPGFAGTSPLAGRVAQVHPTDGTANLTRIRHANGRFMAVGTRGTVAFSNDGLNWSRLGLTTTLGLHDIAYGNGVYVVVGDSGVVFTSPDGVTWTARSTGTAPFTSVAFGNGVFMRSTFLGANSVSTDGVTWQTAGASLPAGAAYSGLDFVNENFVLHNGSTVAFSANGTTTNATASVSTSGTLVNNAKVAFGNGVYILGGVSGVSYSTNRTTWTLGVGPKNRVDAVGFGNGLFVIMDSAKIIWTSTDGAAWEQAGVLSVGISSMAFANGRYVATGQTLHTSVDGKTWFQPETDLIRPNITAVSGTTFYHDRFSTPLPINGPPEPAPIRGVFIPKSSSIGRFWFGDAGYIFYYGGETNFITRGNGLGPVLTDKTLRAAAPISDSSLVLAGDAGAMIRVTRPDSRFGPSFELLPPATSADLLSGVANILVGTGGTILRSTDGRAWTKISSGTTATLRHVRSFSFDEGVSGIFFIAVGDGGTILTSPDGSAWTKRVSGSTKRFIGSIYTGVSTTPPRYLVAAEDGTMVQSTNGITWTPHAPAPVAHRLQTFSAGDRGETISIANAVVAPATRLFFTQSLEAFRTISAAALGNGRWVVVGANVSGVSPDGRDWKFQSEWVNFSGVVFGQGKFVAVAANGIVGISATGTDWRLKTVMNANLSFSGVTYGNGRFVAVGSGVIRISDDGETWVDKTIPLNAGLTAVAYGGGKFEAVGDNGVGAYSLDNGNTWIASGTGGQNQQSVAYGNGRFASVGTDGRVAYTDDGIRWTSARLNGPTSAEGRPFFRRVIFTDGSFFATTMGGSLYQATNGANWSILHTGISADLFGMAAGNGLMILAGGHEIHTVTMPNLGGPSVTLQPLDATVAESSALTLTAGFTGEGLEFSWLKDGQPLVNGGRVSGANLPTLTITGALPADAGGYLLAANNTQGSRATRVATVEITARPPGFAGWASALPVGQQGALDDPDLDGVFNIVEYTFGSNPLVVDAARPQVIFTQVASQTYPAVQYTHSMSAVGVSVQVKASPTITFATSETLSESVESLGGGLERVTIRTTQPAAALPTFFFKITLLQN